MNELKASKPGIDFEEERKKKLKDPEYRREFEKADRKLEREIQRCCYSDFRILWRIGYKICDAERYRWW